MNQQLQQESPATAALEKALRFQPKHVVSSEKPMIKAAALKRSRTSCETSFDMSAFEEASKQVEESIAFPSIEWSVFDDDNDEEDYYYQPSKRSCQGFTRCNGSLDLFSLSSSSCQQRRGSNGSLC
jgi:hypothetical protein